MNQKASTEILCLQAWVACGCTIPLAVMLYMVHNIKYLPKFRQLNDLQGYITMMSCVIAEFSSIFRKVSPKPSLPCLLYLRKKGLFHASAIFFDPPACQPQTWQQHLIKPLFDKHCLASWNKRFICTQSVLNNLNEEDDFESSRRLLFVGGVSQKTNEEVIHNYFSNIADVEAVKMVRNLGGEQKQFCFVKLRDVGCIDQILQTNHTIEGRPLLVHRAKKHRVVVAGNLPSSINGLQLKKHFSKFGLVENIVIPEDRRMKQRKGYSLITFSSQDEAAKAVEQQHHEIGPYKLKVKFLGAHGEDIKTPKILLDNLPFDTSVEDVKDVFSKFGGLKIIDLAIRNDSNKCVAFLTFDNDEVVEELVQMKDLAVGGRVVSMKKEIPSTKFAARLRSIHVGNLSHNVTKTELIDYFSTFGMVYKIVLPVDKVTGKNKGFAVVKYHQRDSIQRVMAQSSHCLGSDQMRVRRFSLVLSYNDSSTL